MPAMHSMQPMMMQPMNTAGQAPAVANLVLETMKTEPPVVLGHSVVAPMVGTFYRSASPGDKSFVEVGQKIKVGQVLCIIEAMKMLNQIESDVEGVVKAVMVENGQPVEYGHILFIIE